MTATHTEAQAQTRQRLLEAAAAVFVEKGYRSATIREICEKAGANVAAVNYHFGDKFTLYRELLISEPAKSFERRPRDAWRRPGMSPEQLFEGFVRDFLGRLLDPAKPAWHAILMAREMSDPTEALDAMIEQFIRPQMQTLGELICQVAGRPIDPQTMGHCIESVVPQIVFHLQCRKVVERINPTRAYDTQCIDAIARHVATFSIAGIRAAAEASRG
jgi:AcrR family transcriptional regulator